MPKIQRKLLLALAVVVAITLAASSWFAERGLRLREMQSIERSMLQRATLVRALLEDLPLDGVVTPRLDTRVRAAAEAAGARITLIDTQGAVVADSEVAVADLPGVENHANRDEVSAALAGRNGISARSSRTVGRKLLYIAIPRTPGADDGVVRMAVGLDEVDAAVASLRRRLVLAGVVGMAAALLLSLAFARRALQPLTEMREVLRDMARGQLGRRLRPRSDDEVGEIALAINGLGEQLGLRLEQITAEKEQLQAVLTSMVEGVLVLDNDERVMLANPRLREQLSMWGPVEGRTFLELVRHPGIDDALRAASGSTTPVVQEVEVGDREPRTLLIHGAAFPELGERLGTVAVFHDVTELRHLEGVRRDFSANASHELKTPLTAIRGFAETLLPGFASEDRQRAQLDAILRNAERLEALIADMMELSRIESRRVPLQPAQVDVVRLVRGILSDMEPRLRAGSLEAELEDADAAPAWADRRALEQVLTNLLDNAIKYSDPGGRIRVHVCQRPDRVRVSVSDTGMGIPEDQQARIFERFYRVDKARSRALGGTGLGLAIVKHLVQAMGGEIHMESKPHEGSTFRFTLPRPQRPS